MKLRIAREAMPRFFLSLARNLARSPFLKAVCPRAARVSFRPLCG
jgi:hypothetical protein